MYCKILISVPEDFLNYLTKDGGKYYCSLCEYSSSNKTHVKDHIESQHFPNTFSYQCPYCDNVVGTNKALKRHIQRLHK